MLLEVTVVPRSGRFEIVNDKGRVKIFLKSAPESNKANMELLKELKRRLKVEVRLVSGTSSRKKTIEANLPEEQLKRMLGI